VHPATASRALNPALPGRITAETTRRVVEAARALGYSPDPTARSLRTRRSGVVGVVVPDLTNPVLPPMVRALEETLWEEGLACLLADTDNRADREAASIAELVARRCEGLIIATAARTSPAVADLAASGYPTVLVTREPDGSRLPLVAGDDIAGVEAAVEHLVGLGHRHLAYVTGPTHLSTTLRREAAFRRTMDRLLPATTPVVFHGDGFTVPAGHKATRQALDAAPGFTALLAGNDMMALGAYRALRDAGLRCPDDVSVVGHNDMPFMDAVAPPLTTVSIPQHQVGSEAGRMLLSIRDGIQPEPRRRLVPVSLVVRSSTGPSART
jgi:LacI family transcriptional regulator